MGPLVRDDAVEQQPYAAPAAPAYPSPPAEAGADDMGDDTPPPGYMTPQDGSSSAPLQALQPSLSNPDAIMPPSYGDGAETKVEPSKLVIDGQTIHDADVAMVAGNAGLPSTAFGNESALYSMNRGIATLSHTDSSVTFERLDHSIRLNPEDNTPRITSRSRHLYDLKHMDDRTAKFQAANLPGYNFNREGWGEDDENIPRFYAQSMSRRTLGSFGLRKMKSGGKGIKGIGGGGKGEATVYAVVPLLRRKNEYEVPHFASVLGGKERRILEIRKARKPDGGQGSGGTDEDDNGGEGSSSGAGKPSFHRRLFSSSKNKVKDPAGSQLSAKQLEYEAEQQRNRTRATSGSDPMFPPEWEWIDEYGRVVAYEDFQAPIIALSAAANGQAPPLTHTAQKPMYRLNTTMPLDRELYDLIVSMWCLRVWWQSADSAPDVLGRTGAQVGRKLKNVSEFGLDRTRRMGW